MKHSNLSAYSAAVVTASLLLSLVGSSTAFAAGPALVNLGSAGNFVVLAKSGVSTTGATAVTGNIGVSPIAASAITGFGLTMDISNTFATSALVTGKVFASDYTPPTPATMTAAISDMQAAYTDSAGRTNPTATELGAGNIGGMTLAPGLYKWSTNVTIPTNLTLSGGANDVWIFQVGQNLTVGSGAHIVLSGGAQASNIFWQVAGQTTVGTTADMSGTILDQTAIVFNTGATLHGRAFAQTAVVLDATVIGLGAVTTVPAPVVVTPTPTPTPTPVVVQAPVLSTPSVTAPAPTVTASSPSMPNTGFPPEANTSSWVSVAVTSILVLAALSLSIVLGKRFLLK